MQLPADLRERIENLVGQDSRKTLSGAATDVSLKYRRESGTASLQISSELEARAYLVTRFPATMIPADRHRSRSKASYWRNHRRARRY